MSERSEVLLLWDLMGLWLGLGLDLDVDLVGGFHAFIVDRQRDRTASIENNGYCVAYM